MSYHAGLMRYSGLVTGTHNLLKNGVVICVSDG